jgi:hypothetical protein
MVAPALQHSAGDFEERRLPVQVVYFVLVAVLVSCASCSRDAPDGRRVAAPGLPIADVGPSGIVCPNPVFDAGQVYEGDVITATFTLQNRSARQRRVEIEPTCECTSLNEQYKILAAGASTELTFEVNTRGMGKKERVEVVNYVHHETGYHSLRLLIKAKVQPLLRSNLRIVQFGKVRSDEVAEEHLRIRQTGARSPRLLGAHLEPDVVAVAIKEENLPSRDSLTSWDVTLSLAGSQIERDIAGIIRLITDDRDADAHLPPIRFYAYKADGWVLIPSSLAFFVHASDSNPISKSVVVARREGQPVEAVEVSSDCPFIVPELSGLAPGGGRLIAVKFVPSQLPPSFAGSSRHSVRLTLNEGTHEIVLPVSYYRFGSSPSSPSRASTVADK